MKRIVVIILVLALLSLLVLAAGCGEAKDGDAGKDGKTGGDADLERFDEGFSDGETQGYEQGYADGKAGVYDPGAPQEADDDYALGFNEGWLAGYEEGYEDASEEIAYVEDEMKEVEEAMLAFVKQNSAPGMEFRIENIVIHGNEAAGIAVCTSEVLESPLVVMEKLASGWSGVDFGTGIEPPSWYQY